MKFIEILESVSPNNPMGMLENHQEACNYGASACIRIQEQMNEDEIFCQMSDKLNVFIKFIFDYAEKINR